MQRQYIVLGGWLGCQPKHLKSYKKLYNSLGFDVVVAIASPLSVIDSTLCHQSLPHNPIRAPSPNQWPNTDTAEFESDLLASEQQKRNTNMQDLAWRVLAKIYNSGTDAFIFHCFSNGGCFLWESLCRILLFRDNRDCDRKIASVLDKLYTKCNGVVYDSCPCWFGSKNEPSKLSQALRHCSPEEREDVMSVHGNRIDMVDDGIVTRNGEYFEYLASLPLDIPQLYLYSKNDELSNHERIAEMIKTRRSRQKRAVLEKSWDHSIHCNHIRKHAEDYTKALRALIRQLEVPREARL
eukprot:jgi/Psemu1/295270/fgenesh1_pm.57_\